MRRICCVCLKIKNKSGWEKAGVPQGIRLSHGYCPKCYREVVDNLPIDSFVERYRKKREN